MDKREQLFNYIGKYCHEHGIAFVKGRQLNPEEIQEQQTFSQGIYDFLRDYRQFKEESRKTRIVARQPVVQI